MKREKLKDLVARLLQFDQESDVEVLIGVGREVYVASVLDVEPGVTTIELEPIRERL